MRTAIATGLLALLLSPGRSIADPREDADTAKSEMGVAWIDMLMYVEWDFYAEADARYWTPQGPNDVAKRLAGNEKAAQAAIGPVSYLDLTNAIQAVGYLYGEGNVKMQDGFVEQGKATALEKQGHQQYANEQYADAAKSYNDARAGYGLASEKFFLAYAAHSNVHPSGVTADWYLWLAGL